MRSFAWTSRRRIRRRARRPSLQLSGDAPYLDFAPRLHVVMMVDRSDGQAAQSLPIQGPLYCLKIVVQGTVELLLKTAAHEDVDAAGIDQYGECHGRCVPDRQPNAKVERSPASYHGSPVRTRKPTPRIVWISLARPSPSTFFRSRAM